MTARLMIVDDDALQLRVLCDTLDREGYLTRGFNSPQAALGALKPGEFDLLLTDLTMPEMDGIALIAAARVIASVQPGHWREDRPFLAARLGERPEVVVHPLASLARAGATVMFGSDWPVSPFDPAYVVAAAVDPSRADEALTRAAALASSTRSTAATSRVSRSSAAS